MLWNICRALRRGDVCLCVPLISTCVQTHARTQKREPSASLRGTGCSWKGEQKAELLFWTLEQADRSLIAERVCACVFTCSSNAFWADVEQNDYIILIVCVCFFMWTSCDDSPQFGNAIFASLSSVNSDLPWDHWTVWWLMKFKPGLSTVRCTCGQIQWPHTALKSGFMSCTCSHHGLHTVNIFNVVFVCFANVAGARFSWVLKSKCDPWPRPPLLWTLPPAVSVWFEGALTSQPQRHTQWWQCACTASHMAG